MLLRASSLGLALALALGAQEAELRELQEEYLEAGEVAEVLEDIVEAYEAALELAAELGDPPLEIARIRTLYGDSLIDGFHGADDPAAAAEQYRLALELRRSVPDARLEVAESLVSLAEALGEDNPDEALVCWEEAVQIRSDELGAADELTRGASIALARAHFTAGRWPRAATVFRRVLGAAEREFGETEPFAVALDAVAVGCQRRGKDPEIIALRTRALAIREKLLGSDTLEFARAVRETGRQFSLRSGRDSILREEAERQFRRAIEIYSGLPDPAPDELADVYSHLVRPAKTDEEKERALRRAIEIRGEAEIRNSQLARDQCALAGLLVRSERPAEAVPLYESCFQLRRDLNDPPYLGAQFDVTKLSAVLLELGEYEEAGKVLILRIGELYGHGDTLQLAVTREAHGDLLLETGEVESAVEEYEAAVLIRRASGGDDFEQLATLLTKLASAYREAGRADEAQQVESQATALKVAAVLLQGDFSSKFEQMSRWVFAGFALFGLVVLGGGTYISFRLARRSGGVETAPAAPPPLERPDHLTTFTVARDQRRFAFHGQGGELFGIWIVNVLKTIVTLGIYYFWGKVKVRRYLWSHAEFSGDRFAFHGTPMELFIGWLKASPLLVFLLWGPQIAALAGQPLEVVNGLSLLAVALVMILWPVAELGAHRYRLTRTSWRGVRFSFHGRSWKYFTIYLLSWPLWLLTLGLWTPFFNALKRRYVVSHMRFGDSDFECDAEGRDMLGPFFINWLLLFPTFGIYNYWYTALRERYYWSRTTFRGARFRSTITGGQLFALGFAGGILIFMTLGLASPWVRCWRMQVWLDSLHVDGDLDLDQIRQQEQDTTATAEGVADFFGLDFGFFE